MRKDVRIRQFVGFKPAEWKNSGTKYTQGYMYMTAEEYLSVAEDIKNATADTEAYPHGVMVGITWDQDSVRKRKSGAEGADAVVNVFAKRAPEDQ